MGPKVKKAPKNAFSFFLDEYVKNSREKGRNVSHKIAAEECSITWTKLTPEEKKKYIELAAAFKATHKENKNMVFTNTGVSLAQLEREEAELKKKIQMADNEIKLTFKDLDLNSLKSQLFYLIHCNYYCKTQEGIYVPGEIAIVEFSVEDGIRRTYHTLINPGRIPLGYAFEAKQTIEDIHGLPFPPYEEGNSNFFSIFKNVAAFLEKGKLPDGRYPPFYCTENNIKASESVLQTLTETMSDEENVFRVYLIHKMFFWLKNKCAQCFGNESAGFPVLFNAENEISKDTYCYAPGISCEFHTASEEKYHNCSLSIVQRLVYIICDHCCKLLDVDPIPGKHSRFKSEPNRETISMVPEFFSRGRTFSSFNEDISDVRSSRTSGFSSAKWKKDDESSIFSDDIGSEFEASCFVTAPTRRLSPSAFLEPYNRRGEIDDDDEDDED